MKTKAAKAAEIALKLKQDNEKVEAPAQEKEMATTFTGGAGLDDAKKVKELERRITKMRNDNQTLSTQLEKATRLLEREIGEVVDIDALYKEESQWKGRAQKLELLKIQLK